jgi:hypothetical protein
MDLDPRRLGGGLDPARPAGDRGGEPPGELRHRLHGQVEAPLQAPCLEPPLELGHVEAVVAGQAPRSHFAIVSEVEDVDPAEQQGPGPSGLGRCA